MTNLPATQGASELVFETEVQRTLDAMSTTCKTMRPVYQTSQYQWAVKRQLDDWVEKLIKRIPKLGEENGRDHLWEGPIVTLDAETDRYVVIRYSTPQWDLYWDGVELHQELSDDEAALRKFEPRSVRAEEAKRRQLRYYEGLPTGDNPLHG